jgi:hypothetical protein
VIAEQRREIEQYVLRAGGSRFSASSRGNWLALKGSDLFRFPAWRDLVPRADFFSARMADQKAPAGARAIASAAEPRRFSYLDGQKAAGCDELQEGERDFLQTAAALNDIAERVFVYLTPITPEMTNMAHACLRPFVARMLEARSDARFKVLTGGWEKFGLTEDDYRSTGTDGEPLHDLNHTNYAGAVKVSSTIGHWIAENAK